jgi:nucleoside-diphosphate-sugar epimerase
MPDPLVNTTPEVPAQPGRMKILVTGVAGECGSKIASELACDHEVWGIDNLATGKRKNVHPKVTLMVADVTDPIGLPSADVIIHTAPAGLDRVTAHAARENSILINLGA